MSEFLQHPGESQNDSLSPEGKAAAHTRRAFLFKLSLAMNAVVGTVLAFPIVRYLVGSSLRKDSDVGSWVDIGSSDDFPMSETRLAEFESPVGSFGDGQTAKVACWVRHVSANRYQVFAVNCAHMGCPVRWFSQSKLFLCPCHGGAYYEDGERAAGPPERGLFEYKTKLQGGRLLIHAGNMPTLATQASCSQKPLINIPSSSSDSVRS